MRRFLFAICLFLTSAPLFSQDAYIFRLCLKNKGVSPFTIEEASSFLSQKSLDRRARQELLVDEHDLPFDPNYLQQITQTGAEIRALSKWAETVAVKIVDTTTVLPQLRNLEFIDTLYCVWKGSEENLAPQQSTTYETSNRVSTDENIYGEGFTQIRLHNGHLLHAAGYRGAGVEIAILDGGFAGTDTIDFFDYSKILEIKSFNHQTNNPLRSVEHGTKVLSCMLSEKNGEFIGTAPDAHFRLFRTEVDGAEEFPVEEDYWLAALEYADSVGVDVVSSSLGYSFFSDAAMNHTQSELDGQTVPMSRGASRAASRGILLFNSAGNEGNNYWKKIIFPADAENIITVGNVKSDSSRSYTSSKGYTADGRIKPDLMAMGSLTTLVSSSGNIVYQDGTSFSTPILAGLGACLRGAFPNIPTIDLINAIKEKGNQATNPDSLCGYGIPDIYAVYEKLLNLGSIPLVYENETPFNIYINHNHLYISRNYINLPIRLEIFSCLGVKMLQIPIFSGYADISNLKKGVYIARIFFNNTPYSIKFIL
jgi:subtilisin family serine protease